MLPIPVCDSLCRALRIGLVPLTDNSLAFSSASATEGFVSRLCLALWDSGGLLFSSSWDDTRP